MKTLKYKNIAFILILFCLSLNGYSQNSADSLYNYLEIAAKNNSDVLQKFAEYQAALQKVPQVGSLPDPEFSMGIFLSPMELLAGKQVADMRLMQMFPWFGLIKNAKDEMSLMAQAKYESFRNAKLKVFFDIQSVWFELFKINQNIRISEKNIEILSTIERLAVIKFKAVATEKGVNRSMSTASNQNFASNSTGMNSMGGNVVSNSGPTKSSSAIISDNSMGSSSGNSGLSDIYRIQIEIGDLQNNIELMKNQRITIVAKFNSFLNRPPRANVNIPDSIISDDFLLSATISDSIMKKNPMLTMLLLEQQSIEARKKMIAKMGFPMVGLGINYSLINKSEMSTSTMNGKDMIMPMITATLPIYRKKYKAMTEEADFLKLANIQNYQSISNSLQIEYYQAMELYQDAKRRIILYENQYLLASKTLNIMLKSFSSSAASLTDILRVHQQTLNYEYKQVEATSDYNISVAWLKRLMASSQI